MKTDLDKMKKYHTKLILSNVLRKVKKNFKKFLRANLNLLEHFMMEVINQNNPTIYKS